MLHHFKTNIFVTVDSVENSVWICIVMQEHDTLGFLSYFVRIAGFGNLTSISL